MNLKPSVAIRLTAGALIFMGMANLFMLLGPVMVINALLGMGEDSDLERAWESFHIYAEQIAARSSLGISLVVYLGAVSFLVSCIYVVAGALMFLRKVWVRKPLLGSLVVIVLWFAVNYLVIASSTGWYLPTLYSVTIYLAVPLALLHRLSRADAGRFLAGRG